MEYHLPRTPRSRIWQPRQPPSPTSDRGQPPRSHQAIRDRECSSDAEQLQISSAVRKKRPSPPSSHRSNYVGSSTSPTDGRFIATGRRLRSGWANQTETTSGLLEERVWSLTPMATELSRPVRHVREARSERRPKDSSKGHRQSDLRRRLTLRSRLESSASPFWTPWIPTGRNLNDPQSIGSQQRWDRIGQFFSGSFRAGTQTTASLSPCSSVW